MTARERSICYRLYIVEWQVTKKKHRTPFSIQYPSVRLTSPYLFQVTSETWAINIYDLFGD